MRKTIKERLAVLIEQAYAKEGKDVTCDPQKLKRHYNGNNHYTDVSLWSGHVSPGIHIYSWTPMTEIVKSKEAHIVHSGTCGGSNEDEIC